MDEKKALETIAFALIHRLNMDGMLTPEKISDTLKKMGYVTFGELEGELLEPLLQSYQKTDHDTVRRVVKAEMERYNMRYNNSEDPRYIRETCRFRVLLGLPVYNAEQYERAKMTVDAGISGAMDGALIRDRDKKAAISKVKKKTGKKAK